MCFFFQLLIAVIVIASVAYAIPIDVGHYAPYALHGPLIHAPVHKVVAEPVVMLNKKKVFTHFKINLFPGISKVLV